MKYWPGGSYLVMKSTPRVPDGIPLLGIGCKYNYVKVLGFSATVGDGIMVAGATYLSRFPDIYSNVTFCPVVRPHLLGRYLNSCNAI